MNFPTNCPLCNSKLVISPVSSQIHMSAYCNCETTWNFIRIESRHHEVTEIILRISPVNTSPFMYAKWLFRAKEVRVETEDKANVYLPWFEPDFSNYNALVDKIKTYILFS